MRRPLVLLAALAVLMVAVAGAGSVPKGGPQRVDADASPEISPDVRNGTFTFAPEGVPQVRDWLASSLARMNPNARRLIDAIDGQVTVTSHPTDGVKAGFVAGTPNGFVLSLDETLGQHTAEIRDHVVAHELGHVVDLALVPAPVNHQLDLGVPRIGGCDGQIQDAGCAPPEERFADTFAKWALDDPVILSGDWSVGYRVAPPSNLVLWGEPLAALGR